MTATLATMPQETSSVPAKIARAGAARPEPLHFQIGRVAVSLRCSVRSVRRDFETLYGPYRQARKPDGAVELEVRRTGRFPRLRPKYVLRLFGQDHYSVDRASSILPYIEWAVNYGVISANLGYYQMHASVMQHGDMGFVFAGSPGSGKSTLAAGLLARGWKYLCDEFALIDPESGLVHPYPKALCAKADAHPVYRRLGLPLPRARKYLKGAKGLVSFLNPLEVRPDAVGSACPVRCILLPRYEPGAEPELEPISRAECAFLLNGLSFNFSHFRERGIDLLADLVRGAECYRLRSGDIQATCDLIDELRGRIGLAC